MTFDIFKLYENLSKSDWCNPTELKELRMYQYKRTQKEFAYLLGVSYETYASWERGRYCPSSPAMALLHIAKYYPEIFLENRKEVIKKLNHLPLKE